MNEPIRVDMAKPVLVWLDFRNNNGCISYQARYIDLECQAPYNRIVFPKVSTVAGNNKPCAAYWFHNMV